ncbi:Bro-N domain-containing protein [Kitasatospora aburaviensis]
MGDEQEQQERMVLVRCSFPVTGQPIRVVMIDGKPWFVTADVCRVLGRLNPSRVRQVLGDGQTQVINSRSINLTFGKVSHDSAGGKPYERGNPMLNVISEAGLYTLIMRSNKPNAGPFQEWVTQDLLLRPPWGHRRPHPAAADGGDPDRRDRPTGPDRRADRPRGLAGVTVHSDGTVHCHHGEMVFHMPDREEDSGPPFGGYYSCPAVERVGIRGSRVLPGCPKLRLVDLIRLRRAAGPEPVAEPVPPPPDRGLVYAELHGARIYGSPPQIAELMRAYGG